jgi:long-chain acyl-CoA synthetase
MNALPDTFRAVIDAYASTQPSAPFLLAPEPGIDIDYATLRKNCVAFAALLDGLGIARGATVSFMLENGLSAATVFLGAMYGGFVVSPVNLLAHDAQLEYTLTHSESRLVFTTTANRDRIEAIRERTGAAFEIHIVDVDGIDLGHDAKPRLAPIRATDPAMLMYTSGTTGMPKGALLSHANMLAAGRAVARSLELSASDRVLSSLPLYHINGQCIATVAPLVSGGSIVMPHRFSVSQWWPLVEKHRPT